METIKNPKVDLTRKTSFFFALTVSITVAACAWSDDEVMIDNQVREISGTNCMIEDGPAIDVIEYDSIEPMIVVENSASFDGGWSAFYKYVAGNIKYPSQARNSCVSERVFIEFVVNHDGSVSDVKVVKGIGPGFDEEAVRVIQNSPKWNPANQGGKLVRQKLVLPITICLG